MTPHADLAPLLGRRLADLTALFSTIASTRMAGVPVLNKSLHVEAVGFVCAPTDDEAAAIGILITPWFMNLVRLPLWRDDSVDGIGRNDPHALGGRCFDFIGAHEPAIGAFSACSLFSPMFEFAGQAAARSTALAVLEMLRAVPEPAAGMPAAPMSSAAPPARRSFLFGRRAVPLAAPCCLLYTSPSPRDS